MLKLVFVDIDGVLNNKEDGTSCVCATPETYGISKKNIEILKKIIRETGAKIVWSTAWRYWSDDHAYDYNGMMFKSHFKEAREAVGKECIFEIPNCPHLVKRVKRDDVLGFFYLLKAQKDIDMANVRFIILDDSFNQGLHEFGKCYFHIDLRTGLTEALAEAAVNFLNKDTPSKS